MTKTEYFQKIGAIKSGRGEIPQYRQISGLIKSYISENNLKQKDRLPSIRELVALLKVSDTTVNRALAELENEGVIERQHGRGIFLANRTETGEFAIVVRPQLLGAESSPYYRMTSMSIIDSLHKHNPEWKIKLHVGATVESGREYPATLDLLEPDTLKRLSGVFSFHPLWEMEDMLRQAGVNLVSLHYQGGKYQVWYDEAHLYRQGLEHFKNSGCRRIGLLWALNTSRQLDPIEQKDRMFSELAKSMDLEFRPNWITPCQGSITEQNGYNLFVNLWNQPERPDGVLVSDDILCRGVMRAILHLGIKLPQDLKLITNSNRGVPIPYHLPVTRFELDTMDIAKESTQIMLSLMDGQIPEKNKVLVPVTFVKGVTA